MKRTVIFFTALIFGALSIGIIENFGSGPTAYAASIKVGVVDFQKVLTASNQGKRATEELNKKGKVMEDEIKSKESELLDLQKKFEKDSLVMSKEKKEEKQKDMRAKFNDFKTLRAKYMNEFKEMQAEHFNKIRKGVIDVASEIGKKDGFTFVIERNEGGIIYFDNTLDITEKVISEYNRRAK